MFAEDIFQHISQKGFCRSINIKFVYWHLNLFLFIYRKHDIGYSLKLVL